MRLLNVTRINIDSHPLFTMLVVDDDHCMLKLYEFMVGSWDLNIEIAYADNGRDALIFLENHFPDILILDINLNDVNGYQLLQSIKKNQQHRFMSIIVITGMTATDYENIAEPPEDVFLMRKPIDFAALHSLTRTIISKRLSKISC